MPIPETPATTSDAPSDPEHGTRMVTQGKPPATTDALMDLLLGQMRISRRTPPDSLEESVRILRRYLASADPKRSSRPACSEPGDGDTSGCGLPVFASGSQDVVNSTANSRAGPG